MRLQQNVIYFEWKLSTEKQFKCKFSSFRKSFCVCVWKLVGGLCYEWVDRAIAQREKSDFETSRHLTIPEHGFLLTDAEGTEL